MRADPQDPAAQPKSHFTLRTAAHGSVPFKNHNDAHPTITSAPPRALQPPPPFRVPAATTPTHTLLAIEHSPPLLHPASGRNLSPLGDSGRGRASVKNRRGVNSMNSVENVKGVDTLLTPTVILPARIAFCLSRIDAACVIGWHPCERAQSSRSAHCALSDPRRKARTPPARSHHMPATVRPEHSLASTPLPASGTRPSTARHQESCPPPHGSLRNVCVRC